MKPYSLLCLTLAASSFLGSHQASRAGEKRAEPKPFRLPFKTQEDGLHAVALSPDGRIVAAGTIKGKIVLWDLESRKELCRVNSTDNQKAWSCRGS